MNVNKQQRIRDPIHDLIIFDGPGSSQLEGTLWNVLQTQPFQRLRRIKQLGFSDFVYPGATHSRFAHSVGVFHTARQLMEIVKRQTGARQDTRENQALAAALVHDVGHGPFSHAFEEVGKQLKLKLKLKLADHETLGEKLIRSGEIAEVLNKEMGKCFSDDVADIIKKDGVKTVHHAVVSSQFDADRLDYIRRDRFMAGSQHAGIDFGWLLANLQIGKVNHSVDDTPLSPIETFVLGPKAVHAAEAYVLGLFQLYPTVYFHKTTRGAEKLFEELLFRIVDLTRQKLVNKTGLVESHPLIRFAKQPDDISAVLLLDDTTVWGALAQLADAQDNLISQFAKRLKDREFLKCIDVRMRIALELDPQCLEEDKKIEEIDKCCALIKNKLKSKVSSDSSNPIPSILFDDAERSPYRAIDKSKGPLGRIMIDTGGGKMVDLRQRSSVVRSLKTFKLFRVYVDRKDSDKLSFVENAIQEGIRDVRKTT